MRARCLVLSVAISIVGLASMASISSATFSGTNGRVAFASDAARDRDIWTINPDGSGAANVTDAVGAPGWDREPDYSPNGTKIAFRSGQTDAAEIYTMNADGTGGLTQLTSNAFKDWAPAWSPDGSKIAFGSNRNDPNFATCVGLFQGCNDDIFVIPATGGAPVQVTFDSGQDEFPQFSPDGTHIAYSTDLGGASAIYTVALATLTTTKLTTDSLRAGEPDYSPDGTKIAFENNFYACKTNNSDCKSDVFVMNADGGGVTRLTRKFGTNYSPNWSPEGDKLVFTHANLGGREQIYEMNPDGTGITRITHTSGASSDPDWGSG